MAESVKQLVQKRAQVKAQLTRFRTFLDGFNLDQGIMALETRLQKFELLYDKFDEIQSTIENVAGNETETEAFNEEREMFEAYFELVTRSRIFMQGERESNHAARRVLPGNLNAVNEPQLAVKLPVIKLPVFDGLPDKWLKFRDTFQSMIDNNQNLTNIQKFHYLESAITGDAARAIEALGISDVNYITAWRTLKSRFEDPRALIHFHVRGLFELPAMTKNSYLSLRQLMDKVNNHILALQNLGEPVESWDSVIIYLFSTKLDMYTKREWDKGILQLTAKPKFEDIVDFLSTHCKYLERSELSKPDTMKDKATASSSKTSKFKSENLVTHTTPKLSCPICKTAHSIYHCEEFIKLPIQSRISEVQKHQLCFNCLKPNHKNKDCTSGHCKKCSKKHNSLLHREESSQETTSKINASTNVTSVNQPSKEADVVCYTQRTETPVILATALINIHDSQGNLQDCRVLLDGGAQSHFITRELCDKLKLHLLPINQPVSGLGNHQTNLTHKAEIEITSKQGSYCAKITCLVIPKITSNMPNVSIDKTSLKIPKDLPLADPQFNVPRPIDVLIGAELFWYILCIDRISLGPAHPVLQKTKFGWILGGPMATVSRKSTVKHCHLVTTQQLHDRVAKFWELEECHHNIRNKPEDSICEEYFAATITRNENGRFVVSIPFRENLKDLGQSKGQAHRRLLAIERKLERDTSLSDGYKKFMQDFEASGHMTKISAMIPEEEKMAFYLPHHAVRKEGSTTTKIRVVFDGSAKTSSGLSINDTQYVGPVVQDDLFSILIRFRKHKFVISADIKQMYRQVLIREDQRKFQRILWRDKKSMEISEYQLNTVTYGMAAAPYLATRCLQQIAKDNAESYPAASEVILKDFYMDDLLSGAESVSEAHELKQTLSDLLRSYGFELRKWASNNSEIVCSEEDKSRQLPFYDLKDPKTLGLLWNPEEDTMSFAWNTSKINQVTKRTILSTVASIFDPLRLIVPVVVTAKLILQRLWQLNLGWDEALPLDLQIAWNKFYQQFDSLNKIKVARQISLDGQMDWQLHGFSDASERAYGACIYARVPNGHGTFEVSLLCAKSRIAPLKTVTLPRLELCEALLLSRLMKRVSTALKINKEHQYFWCDSTIVLCYLAAEPSRWATFVANRTAEIQELTNKNWNHVPTVENPADLASRGITIAGLSASNLWWKGPHWLQEDKQTWPDPPKAIITNLPDVKSKPISVLVSTNLSEELGSHFSSFNLMTRVLAYALRFIENVRQDRSRRKSGPLSTKELADSSNRILRLAQHRDFAVEITGLQEGKQVPKTSKITNLQPFLHTDGCLRVGGRIRHASIPFEQKHPILISHRNIIAQRIVENEHHKLLHAGPQLVLASLRTKYWITAGKSFVKQTLRNCVICCRVNPTPFQYRMGDLPRSRVTPARPFFTSGVDYAGPFFIRERVRSKVVTKSYLCIFVCFATKAVHFELAIDMSTKAFLNCLRRFIARRGKCQAIYSDNGTNFVGAASELAELGKLLKDKSHNNKVKDLLSQDQIAWHNIPPHAPNFGGLWESAVKSAKYHLKRVLSNLPLTYEELFTVLVQVEGILNSRPLSPLSDDPKDLIPLTPAHFLIGDSLMALPQPDFQDININRLTRYERLQQLVQHFWRRWNVEYLHQLQTRNKWKSQSGYEIQPGMLVVVREDNTAPMHWPLGRIERVHPGKDEIIRVVTVRTATGTYKRPLSKICILPIEKPKDFE